MTQTEVVTTADEPTRAQRLRDGTEVELRPIGPGDAAALVDFHEGLSTDSIHYRFFTHHPHLSTREVERFTTVDHQDREAYVLVADDEIIAVGRYDRLTPSGDIAEVAFVVTDAWQGHGAATVLLQALAARAERDGIRTFVADVLPDNRRMLHVFQHSGLVSSCVHEAGVLHLEMPLDG
jgi:RimJ/RimL family protein N-acetyltransferase